MVLLPEPEGPTKAVVLSAGKSRPKLSKTTWLGREGYICVMFLSSIVPRTSLRILPPSEAGLIKEGRSIAMKIFRPAAAALINAAILGANEPDKMS